VLIEEEINVNMQLNLKEPLRILNLQKHKAKGRGLP